MKFTVFNLPLTFTTNYFYVCVFIETSSEDSDWGRLELSAVILVPSCLLCVGVFLCMCAVRNQRCLHVTGRNQDPEEPLDDQSLVSSEKCLKELIYDMSTSGSGS
ncbi:activin receptor type-1C, partial [Tachysurus ichikawai]